eukprot:3346718-Rhodomonas_salina.1
MVGERLARHGVPRTHNAQGHQTVYDDSGKGESDHPQPVVWCADNGSHDSSRTHGTEWGEHRTTTVVWSIQRRASQRDLE